MENEIIKQLLSEILNRVEKIENRIQQNSKETLDDFIPVKDVYTKLNLSRGKFHYLKTTGLFQTYKFNPEDKKEFCRQSELMSLLRPCR